MAAMRWVARDDIGCTDENSPDYDPVATISAPQGYPGNCIPGGCMDPLADNYDVMAKWDDGSCEYTGVGDRKNYRSLGKIQILNSEIIVPVRGKGEHSLIISSFKGNTVYEANGRGVSDYTVKDLTSGNYVLTVEVNGAAITKAFTIK
jgi:hypothetical protein